MPAAGPGLTMVIGKSMAIYGGSVTILQTTPWCSSGKFLSLMQRFDKNQCLING